MRTPTAQGIYLITVYGAFVVGLSVGHSWLWLPVSCICAPMAWIAGYWYEKNRNLSGDHDYFIVTIVHRLGRIHTNVDPLSRNPASYSVNLLHMNDTWQGKLWEGYAKNRTVTAVAKDRVWVAINARQIPDPSNPQTQCRGNTHEILSDFRRICLQGLGADI